MMVNISEEELNMLANDDTKIIFLSSPHPENSQKHIVYQAACEAKTIAEAKFQFLGAIPCDLRE